MLLSKQQVYSKFTAPASIDLNCCDNDVAQRTYLPIFTTIHCNNNLNETDRTFLVFSLSFSLVVADQWAKEEIRTGPFSKVRISSLFQVLPSKSKFKFLANSLRELDISVN